MKRRMAASGMKGTYAERPMDPTTKRAARKAEAVAVHSLSDAYRKLLEFVLDHNNRPHTALKRKRILAQAGVRPCPTDAYLWGLENISGLRIAPFSDQDYKRLLLASDVANIASGVLRYRGRPYLPMNEAAIDLAERSSKRAKQVDIRVDKTVPYEVFIVTRQGEWAAFQLTRGAESEIAGLTLDEEDALSSQTALLWAKSEHESRVKRVVAQSKMKASKFPATPATKVDKSDQLSARAQETAAMKKSLTDEPPLPVMVATPGVSVDTKDWEKIEEEERLRNLDLIRKHRSKR
jgi:putative transposase